MITQTTICLFLGNIRDILGTAMRNRNEYRRRLDAVSNYMQKFKVTKNLNKRFPYECPSQQGPKNSPGSSKALDAVHLGTTEEL